VADLTQASNKLPGPSLDVEENRSIWVRHQKWMLKETSAITHFVSQVGHVVSRQNSILVTQVRLQPEETKEKKNPQKSVPYVYRNL